MKELDNKLSEDDLDGIVDEIDEDGSGTVDFDGKYFLNIFLRSGYVCRLQLKIETKIAFLTYI